MDLTPYVDSFRRQLAVAAEAGGEDARELAERLLAPLESAARLVLLEALSAAADEITSELAPGSVHVRLRGRDPGFVVTPPPIGESFDDVTEDHDDVIGAGTSSAGAAAPHVPPEGEEGGTSRISLRVPEYLKPHIEDAARREGLSVNAWLVRAVSAALGPDGGRRRERRGNPLTGRRYTGWVR